MKLLCFTKDHLAGEIISAEARNQKWSALLLNNRESVARSVQQFNPDLVLVDARGPEDLRWWRKQELLQKAPTIYFNAEASGKLIADALASGTISAFARLAKQGDSIEVRRLGLTVHSDRQLAEIRGATVTLTWTETRILKMLAVKNGVVRREEIKTEVFSDNGRRGRVLDVHICALRKKLRPHGLSIESVRGVGYQLISCSH